jgi:HSP20 family protein
MKNKLVSILTAGLLIASGIYSISSLHAESEDNSIIPTKTVAINTAPAQQAGTSASQQGGIYDKIMESQKRMDDRMSKFLNDPFFRNHTAMPPSAISGMGMGAGMGNPNSRFYKKDKEYILQFVVPGIDKKNISLELNGNLLTVSAKNDMESSTEDNNYQSYRNVSRAFTQSFNIPPDVNTAKIKSKYKNGVLTIIMPKDPAKANSKPLKITVD